MSDTAGSHPPDPAGARLRGPWSLDEIRRYLDATVIPVRLAAEAPSGWPLVVSVWFAREGGELLCATSPNSALVLALDRRPRCAFEVAADEPPYRGVRGRAEVVIDHDAGAETLERLLIRYLGRLDGPLARRLLKRSADEVCLRLRPVSLSSWDYTARMAPEP